MRLRRALDEWKIVLTIDPSDAAAKKALTALEGRIEKAVTERIEAGKAALARGVQVEARRQFLAALALDPKRRRRYLQIAFGFAALAVAILVLYLLRDFPGRFTSGQLWVEALPSADQAEEDDTKHPARGGDGVSSIIITSNDFAGAWAMRQDGQAMLPLVSAEPRQREFAFRAGVNIVMYTLTGNYKADQVHVPALLERLGQ